MFYSWLNTTVCTIFTVALRNKGYTCLIYTRVDKLYLRDVTLKIGKMFNNQTICHQGKPTRAGTTIVIWTDPLSWRHGGGTEFWFFSVVLLQENLYACYVNKCQSASLRVCSMDVKTWQCRLTDDCCSLRKNYKFAIG